jgi:hypothetical protein
VLGLNPEFKAMWRDNGVRGFGEGVRTDRACKGAVAFVAMLAQGQLRRPTHLRDQYRVPIRQLRTDLRVAIAHDVVLGTDIG